eukprot:TRINITY_DN244_c0_g1_i2.p1 TRINITY_DN244_c0_g1~~TRINITY_DN244_c0_g1_i2.p1  ORF type:complete len:136 (+),score=24.47 TRINITY_DN244_c0_g1_i2:426-833(+)
MKRYFATKTNGNLEGEGLLLGGLLTIGPHGQGVVFEHREKEPGDYTNTEMLKLAVKKMYGVLLTESEQVLDNINQIDSKEDEPKKCRFSKKDSKKVVGLRETEKKVENEPREVVGSPDTEEVHAGVEKGDAEGGT